jgi:hypothetical protein
VHKATIVALTVPHLSALAQQALLQLPHPVVVQSQGKVYAVSTGNRTYVGMPAGRAKTLLLGQYPSVHVVTRNLGAELAFTKRLLQWLFTCTPNVYLYNSTTIFLQHCQYSNIQAVCQRFFIQSGIATTQRVAQIASLHAAPSDCLVVEQEHISRFLETVPIGILRDVAEITIDADFVQRCTYYALHTLGRLRMLQRQHMVAQFGAMGIAVHTWLQGITNHNPVPSYNAPSHVQAQQIFLDAVEEPSELHMLLPLLCNELEQKLATQSAGYIEVQLLQKNTQVGWQKARILRSPLGLAHTILPHAETLLRNQCTPTVFRKGVWGLRLVAGMINIPKGEQTPLFAPKPSIEHVLKTIHARYHPILKQIVVNNPYAYLPEDAYSIVPAMRGYEL